MPASMSAAICCNNFCWSSKAWARDFVFMSASSILASVSRLLAEIAPFIRCSTAPASSVSDCSEAPGGSFNAFGRGGEISRTHCARICGLLIRRATGSIRSEAGLVPAPLIPWPPNSSTKRFARPRREFLSPASVGAVRGRTNLVSASKTRLRSERPNSPSQSVKSSR